MKEVTLVLILALLISCGTKQSAENLLDDNKYKDKEINPSWFGSWINVEYLENISNSKSPYNVSLKTPYEFLIINKENAKSNSIKVTWENQFLSEFPGYKCYRTKSSNILEYIGFAYGNEKPDMKNGYDSILPPHQLKLDDEILSIINSNEKTIQNFIKLSSVDQNQAYQILNKKINDMLVTGRYYNSIDTLNSEIEFKSEGRVNGIPDVSYYKINLFFWQENGSYKNDFIEMYDTNVDSIKRKNGPKKLIYFSFLKDTLCLFRPVTDEISEYANIHPEKGNMTHKLIKINKP